MVNDKLLLWLTFVLVGAATLLPRSSFIVAGHRIQLSPNLQSALRYAPAAALAAFHCRHGYLVYGKIFYWIRAMTTATVSVPYAQRRYVGSLHDGDVHGG